MTIKELTQILKFLKAHKKYFGITTDCDINNIDIRPYPRTNSRSLQIYNNDTILFKYSKYGFDDGTGHKRPAVIINSISESVATRTISVDSIINN